MRLSENRKLATAVLIVCILASIILFGGGGLRNERYDILQVFSDGTDTSLSVRHSMEAYLQRCAERASALAEQGVKLGADAALIEDVCDEAGESMGRIEAAKGRRLRPRFSPGYGDFSIEHQRDITSVLDTARRIGLTVTDSLMLAPMKSVTAVIGVAETEGCAAGGCGNCGKKDCEFRRL